MPDLHPEQEAAAILAGTEPFGIGDKMVESARGARRLLACAVAAHYPNENKKTKTALFPPNQFRSL
ncbi:hypothetical protein [Methylocystis parvus]|uniref:hypothetical protein n=1 Tax=Methylocystis parvus TaxID=134 RepID=UPI003C777F24